MVVEAKELEDLNSLLEDKNDLLSSNDNTISSNDEGFPYSLSLRIENIEDEKELKRFIKSTEGLIRRSPEYKLWTSYVRDVFGCAKCNVTDEVCGEVTIEIHHHPFTLFHIVKSEIIKSVANNNEFCSFDIATKIIEYHYQNKIGYTPLVKTLHEKFHNGYFELPMEIVKGNYEQLIKKNMSYLDEEERETIDKRLKINKDNCGWTKGIKWVK